jgi:hypothetical protein
METNDCHRRGRGESAKSQSQLLDIPKRELLELATGDTTKGLFVGCSCSTDMMDLFMIATIIQFVSTNLTDRVEQIGVSVLVLKRSGDSRHRRRTPSPETVRRAWIRLS